MIPARSPAPASTASASFGTRCPTRPPTTNRPLRHALRYAIGLWYLLLYAALLSSVVRRGRDLLRREWLPLALVILCFAAAHVTYWSNLPHARPRDAGALRVGTGGLAAPGDQFGDEPRESRASTRG